MDGPASKRGSSMRKKLSENLTRVRERIGEAAAKVGREPQRVTLVAVTKAVDPETIRALIELGQLDLGESRGPQLIQRAAVIEEHLSRRAMLEQDKGLAMPRWHMVGHLQRNKVKPLIPAVSMIHSVDTLRLAEEINAQAGKADRRMDVLVQVDCAGESQKYGMPVAAAGHFVEQVMPLSRLRVRGLMCMAPLVDDPEKTRPVFERLYELFLEIKMTYRLGRDFEHLSMGMSQDYHVAVECGATMVRVGSALFEGLETAGV